MTIRQLDTGDRVGDIVIGERLHAGAMAHLFAARGADDRALVVKVPRLGADGGEGLLGFETEAMILPALGGPHVPAFVAAGDVVDVPYLAMERIEGRTLDERIGHGPLPIEEVARLGAAIADALQSVHGQGAVHLDLKPENMIERPDGRVVLIDFGLAHHARFPDLLAEELRYHAGSAPYLSPEQLRDVRSDPRSDLFALGVILYEAATGELPFGIPETRAGLHDRLWRTPLPPRQRRAEVPPWMQEIILRCLEIDAGTRYQTAAHLAFDLRHPEQVTLTSRAETTLAPSPFSLALRWWRARRAPPPPVPWPAPQATPVIMVAVDTVHLDDPRQPALQTATARLLGLSSEFRLMCVSVVPDAVASGPGGPHVDHLVRLRHWVAPLRLPLHRLSLHVIEGSSPTSALLTLARANHVDLLVLGAPGPDQPGFAWWRSVASGVAAAAPCSVHLVRVPDLPR